MVDVLLTHSYHLPYDQKQLRKMQPYMPLGTLYAAAALRREGISVAVFDPMLTDPERFESSLHEHCPRIVAIYEDDFNFLSKMCLTRMRDVAFGITASAKRAGVTVISHGSDATDHPDLFLQRGVDYVLRGEAEETLVALCAALIKSKPPGEIDGLVSRTATGGAICRSQNLSRNPNWIDLPEAARDLIDLAPYRKAWSEAHGYFSVNMVASRGCPFRCNWCAKPISGNAFHLRPAAAVAEEMRRLKVEIAAEHIWFGDDVFGLRQSWIQQFSAEVAKRDAALSFKIQSRADLMSDATVAALKSSGCTEVWMGVESGSQKILDAMDKGLKLSSVINARRRLGEAGIRACYFLQLGYPGETWENLQETITFIRNTRPDDIGVSFSYPLPGTVFFENVKAELGKKRNWADSDDLCIMFNAAYTTEFYRAVRDALHAEVTLRTGTPGLPMAAQCSADELWRTVFALEPLSRITISAPVRVPAFSATEKGQGSLLPVTQLLATKDV